MINNPILCAAIMILWLVALPGFVTISSVSRLVQILSLVVPATVFTYFGIFGSHYNRWVQSRLQNLKSQYQFAYWKLLELGAIFLNCWIIRVSGVSAPYWRKCTVFSIAPCILYSHLISTPTDVHTLCRSCVAKGVPFSDARPTRYDMLPQHQINIGKSISVCF